MTRVLGGLSVLLLLAAMVGLNYYIARRLWQCLHHMLPRLRFGVVLFVLLALGVVMLLGFAGSVLSLPAAVKGVFSAIGFCWMGVFLYLLLFLLLADAAVVLLGLLRVVRLPVASGTRFVAVLAAAVLALGVSGYGFAHARQLRHVSYDVTLSGKADLSDLRIVMISDVHLGALGSESRLEGIVREINSLSPDLVLIAGDFFDTNYTAIRDPEKAERTLQTLSATHGVYACLGNHDAGSTNGDMLAFLERSGIRALLDEAVVVDDRLVLVGRLDGSPIGGFGELRRKELSEFFSAQTSELPVIVLDHNPGSVHTYTGSVDLVLSGHTHKGQIFPASLVTDWMYAVDHGYYRRDENSPHVIVTSGVGYWGMPMRVGTDCEIVSITLRGE